MEIWSWKFVKKFENFKDSYNVSKKDAILSGFGYTSSESENFTFDHITQIYPDLFSLSINLEKEDINGGSPSQRPIWMKESELKRKNDDQTSDVIKILEEGN